MKPHSAHQPIGSPFTAESTADDVVVGRDLTGRTVIVTGGHAGIGLEVTRSLASAGAAVTVGARDPERARRAVGGIDGVEVAELDLVEPGSVDAFAARWLRTGRPLHMLINNAAAPPTAAARRDRRGYEMQFATGHLGHFRLTLALREALRAAGHARVVNVSSGAQRFGEINWDDPHFQNGYDAGAAYAQTKKANVLFAVELDRRWAADGIRGYAVHPGVVAGTTLNSAAGAAALRQMGLIDDAGRPVVDPRRGKKTPQQGAATVVFAATSELLEEVGGVYLLDNDVSPIVDDLVEVTSEHIPAYVTSSSIDPEQARRLWTLSERLNA
ncbi:SDR family NAD(P)-dependent oxidoreductase [Mycobacterium sp. WMMD1722]|uniref:SDR family NAD(P)-dependent oxidoreductase n=1 Tax=Mycobacterium sp. WMMD1722 TaxID=3404117 RepID=UPI003BF611F9